MESILGVLSSVNNSPYLVAAAMFFMNITSRFLLGNLSPAQEYFLMNSTGIKIAVIYAICFMASRNLIVAFTMGTILVVLIRVFLNENSRYTVIPASIRDGFAGIADDKEKIEYDKAMETVKKYEETHPETRSEPVVVQSGFFGDVEIDKLMPGADSKEVMPIELKKQRNLADVVESYFRNLDNLIVD
ncbi:MAG: hypothetical protein F2563_04145 [Actinobacteria bacterium]|jgi:hypothetical protein|uniref:Unannotated protein n=1 Tax=freshwater metagenome TaxID=449393 RepID=A0A6J6EXM1_9ZZZZ|nr:hypothetical protein [Actinomycetota bacterium]